MALPTCVSSSQVCISLRIGLLKASCSNCITETRMPVPKSMNSELFGQQVGKGKDICINWSFLGGSRTISKPNFSRTCVSNRKSSAVYASWIPSSEIAGTAFTLGTAAVVPFYTSMIVAPKTEFTKKVMESSIPHIVLGMLYSYVLYLSWTSDTIRLIFASKYLLPELPGIANLFSNEITVASVWIHLLTVDLYAARQVYNDGMRNNIEIRHSVSLCMLSCPIGIVAHLITKAIIIRSRGRKTEH